MNGVLVLASEDCFMRQKDIDLLYNYYVQKEARLHMDVIDYEDRYRLRSCDQIDHLESIIAITRYEAFKEYFNEIIHLLSANA